MNPGGAGMADHSISCPAGEGISTTTMEGAASILLRADQRPVMGMGLPAGGPVQFWVSVRSTVAFGVKVKVEKL